MPEIKLELSINEVNALLALMGDTQAKYGYFPLMQKVKEQAESQLPKEEPKE